MFKKTLVAILFIGLVLVIVGLALTKGDFSKTIEALTQTEEYENMEKKSSNSISNVFIDVVSNNVNFYKSEDESITVKYFESDNDKINVSFDNGKLSVIGEYKNRFRFFNFRIKPNVAQNVDIYLPVSYSGIVDINIVSGKLNIDNFSLEKFDAQITSGSATIKNINIDTNLNLLIVSGNANLENVNIINDASFDITSGSLFISTIEANKIEADIVSGKADLKDISINHINAKVTSGKIEVEINGLKEDYKADLDVTTGTIYYDGIKLKSQTLNENKTKSIVVDVTSGDIIIEFIKD